MKKLLSIILSTLFVASTCILPSTASSKPKKMGATGTFMQPFLYAYLSEDRIAAEFEEMHKSGIDTIIMGDSALRTSATAQWDISYPSTIDEFKDIPKSDNVSILFKYCKKYNMKLFLGLGFDFSWFSKNMKEEENAIWLKEQCELNAKIARDIFNLYDSYGETFGGYYLSYEIGNDGCWNNLSDRNKYADNIAKGWNIVLDAINSFDKTRPLLFNPYATDESETAGFASSSSLTLFYMRLLSKTHFRKQDIMAPMDNLGGGGQSLETVEKWTKAYKTAITLTFNKIQYWANCEIFRTKQDNSPATIDSYSKQLEIASKYASKIITFSWYHYHNPYNTDPGFQKSYLYYMENGTLENVAPTLPNSVSVTGSDVATISTSGFSDEYGISGYRLSKVTGSGSTAVSQNYIHLYNYDRTAEILSKKFENISLDRDKTNYFILEGIDCTGNVSKIYIPVKGNNASDRSGFSTGDKGYYTEDEYNQIINNQ